MNKTLRTILLLLASLVLFYVGVTLLANLARLADVAEHFSPGAGQPVFWGLVVLFVGLAAWPLLLFHRLPRALVPPATAEGPAYEAYLARLRLQLRDNPHLVGRSLAAKEDLQQALEILGQEANQVVKETASAVFVSTAVMQNGRLDGLVVLATQLRMVWRIATIYAQRPSPRQLLYLYANVGSNVLVADSLQEIEFTEIATPIVTAVFPSLKGAVPGMQGSATLLVNSLANGAANAFLTLRIGIIARDYCMATSEPAKAAVRKGATLSALALVRDIAREQGSRVVNQAWEVVRGTVESAVDTTVQGSREAIARATTGTVDGVRSVGNALGRSWSGLKDSAGRLRKKKTD